jgi:hypothetical protein
MPTFIQARVSGGAETVTDQLKGTAVAFAGPTGHVVAGAVSVLTTTTILLKGRQSGKEIIPNGSFASTPGALTALEIQAPDFIYEGDVMPGEPLELQITAAGATTTLVGVRTS